ncbi:hypothetical protein ACI65C_005271 [Semiaphis heraclei]
MAQCAHLLHLRRAVVSRRSPPSSPPPPPLESDRPSVAVAVSKCNNRRPIGHFGRHSPPPHLPDDPVAHLRGAPVHQTVDYTANNRSVDEESLEI